MKYELDIQTYGDRSVLISWPAEINKQISRELLSVKLYLEGLYSKKLTDTSNGYNSILLLFKKNIQLGLIEEIKRELINWKPQKKDMEFKTWKIPVCYDFGVDLEEYLKLKQITISKLIAMHSQQKYHVYGKGFLPGFLYLGGLNKELFLPRKSVPMIRVPKNSVGIGGEQTGIYPSESPGGWYIIGRIPITLFNVNKKPSMFIKAGDSVLFQAISKEVFHAIKSSEEPLDFVRTIE